MQRQSICIMIAVFYCLIAGRLHGPAPVTALAFSPDGQSILSASYGVVNVRPIRGSQPSRRIPFPLSQIHSIAFHPGGKLFAIGGGTPGAGGAICLATWPEGRIVTTFHDHSDLV